MGKQPAFQFYPNDWSRDLEEHPLEIEGAWIRICCKLWWAEERGKLNRTVDQWARILRISNGEVMSIVNYIKEYKIGDVTVSNNLVTVINRRMYREYKERENTRLRVQRHREKRVSNTDITSPSSSSAPSSSSKKKKRVRWEYPEEFERLWKIHPKGGKMDAYKSMQKLDPDQQELDRWMKKLVAFQATPRWKEGYDPYLSSWINGGQFEGEIPKIEDNEPDITYLDETLNEEQLEARRHYGES